MKHEHFLIAGIVSLALIGPVTLFAEEEEGDYSHHSFDKGGPQKEVIEKFDKDGDGKLSEEEKEAAREEHRKRMKEEMLKRFDKDGDGKLSEKEEEAAREEHKQKMLKEFDKNGDGELSHEERRAMHREMMQKRWGEKKRRHCEGKGEGKEEKDEEESILPKPPTEE